MIKRNRCKMRQCATYIVVYIKTMFDIFTCHIWPTNLTKAIADGLDSWQQFILDTTMPNAFGARFLASAWDDVTFPDEQVSSISDLQVINHCQL